MAGLLPLEAASQAGDRRHDVWDDREHRRRRRRRHPRLLSLACLGHRTRFFGREHFTYDAHRDVYHCPGGQELRFRKHKYTERTRVYQAPATACNACQLKSECTDSAKGRQVKRSFDEPYLERVRAYHVTAEFAKAMRKRQVWVEPLFAEGKAWHGLGRFRLRGLPRVNMEALLIAAGQNLKCLLSRWGWGRRPFPSGAAGIVLPALPPQLAPTLQPQCADPTRADSDTAPHCPSPFSTGWPITGPAICLDRSLWKNQHTSAKFVVGR
ncbi:MAG: hypothetical protein K0Q71_5369 [Thermomicrobiales bacterium]|nr:hypothetical protein [Thermomicrobiales bacterium]